MPVNTPRLLPAIMTAWSWSCAPVACMLCKHVAQVSAGVNMYMAFHATSCSFATAAAHNSTLQAVSLPQTAQIYLTSCNIAHLSNRIQHCLRVTQRVVSSTRSVTGTSAIRCGLPPVERAAMHGPADAWGSIAAHALQLHAFNESGQTLDLHRSQAVLQGSAISTR